jgi:putative ABC transport system ATP-binding protein
MIEARNLSVTFNRGTPIEMPALRDIDLAIPAGQFLTVIGSNGAGKTTLLNVISGEVAPESGHIVIDGEDVTRWPRPRRAALIGRVFQDPVGGSCADLTIEENMSLASARGRRRGFALAIDRQRREGFGARLKELGLGLEERLSDRMGLLSGGQRQAISLLMATLSPMKILLLDEHTAALDPKTAEFVINLTRRVVEKHRLTTMMVTHSMRQALELGDRTVMLHGGRIVLDVSGEQRQRMDVQDLLELFAEHRGQTLPDSDLLLG